MANPLFDALSGRSNAGMDKVMPTPSQSASMPSNGQQMNMMDAMAKLKSDPAGMLRQAGYNVPDEVAQNPQAAVMHLIQSGQVGGALMQKIQPMLRMLGVK